MSTHPSFLLTQGKLPAGKDFSEKEISAEVLHHLEVRRIKPNEVVLFMDGSGAVLEARCKSTKPFSFESMDRKTQDLPLPLVELCLGCPKGDALTEAVAQSVEMGAAHLYLIRSDRSQYKADADSPWERTQRVADAACEQSARAHRLEVYPGWAELSDLLNDKQHVHIFADESLSVSEEAGFVGTPVNRTELQKRKVRLYIGPEGGWSREERELFKKSGAHSLSLGSLILRVPTACVAALQSLRLLA